MHHIGPYTFSEQDARKTVANLPILFELAAVGRDSTVLDGLMPEFTDDLDANLRAAWAAWNQVGSARRCRGVAWTATARPHVFTMAARGRRCACGARR